MTNPIETVPGVVERPTGDHGTHQQAIEFAIDYRLCDDARTFLNSWMHGDLAEWPDYYAWLDKQLAACLASEKAPVGGGEPLPVDHIAQLIRIHAGTMGAGRLAEMILATLSPAPIPEAAASLAVGDREAVLREVIGVHKAFDMYGYSLSRCEATTDAILRALNTAGAGGGEPVWPEWATALCDILREYNGEIGDEGGIDLPEELRIWIEGYATEIGYAPPTDRPDSGEVTTREFTNELGNRIKITIEGPTSISENILTPMEVQELSAALRREAPRPGDGEAHPVFAYLLGEGPLDGVWFGEGKPAGERGNFWWRKHLRAALSTPPAGAVGDGDPACTDCGGTGITIQTERRCSCAPPLSQQNGGGE